jgi:tRNA(fMet)-specific endonuclease VapC
MAYLLDSNTLIYFFKNTGAVRLHMSQHKDADLRLCTPVLFELFTGAFKAQNPSSQIARLKEIEKRLAVLPFDLESARQAAKTRAHLERLGTPIGNVDTLIAGVALAYDLTLVTRNSREFARVPDLRLENWYD